MTECVWTQADLMRVHVDALFTHDTQGRLLCVNEPGGAPAPRMFLGRTRAGNVLRTRADLAPGLVAKIAQLCGGEPPLEDDSERPRCAVALIELLERHGTVRQVWRGPAYRLAPPAGLLGGGVTELTPEDGGLLAAFPEWVDELRAGLRQPFFALIEHGMAVSICASVRITPAAHEAGVETLPEHRGRGCARRVVAAWAQRVQTLGAVPLYSTSFANEASRAVAAASGAQLYGVDFHVT